MTQSITTDSSRRVLTGLLGAPIAKSASPAMHERAAEVLGFAAITILSRSPVPTGGTEGLAEGVRRLGLPASTSPFLTRKPCRLLDECRRALRDGAVNTVVYRDDRLIGYNTDRSVLRAPLPVRHESRPGAVAVIGAGGVGKAIAFALAGLGVDECGFSTASRQGRAPGCPAPTTQGDVATASTTRCTVLRAWSTLRRSGCCRTSTAGSHALLHDGFGSPTRSTRHCGPRCSRRPGPGAQRS